MSIGQYFSERYMPFDPDVSEKDRRTMDEVSEDYDRRMRDVADARAKKVSEIVERGNRQVRDLLGDSNWMALRKRMRQERMKFRDLLQPPTGLTANYDELNAKRRANVQAFFDTLKVDASRLRSIFADTRTALHDVLAAPKAEPGYATWLHNYEWMHPADAPGADVRSAWTAFRPPYPGWQRGFDPHNLGGFRIGGAHALDAAAGLVGHDITLDNNDADDFDNGWAIADTQVAFAYRAPATGLVEIIIEARHGRGLHHLRVQDEFGTSDSSTTHENFFMAHVLHPNVNGPSFALMSRFEWRTDNTGVLDRQFLEIGKVYSARLFSSGPVQQNQVVEIRAGTRSQDGSITNDMEINSLSAFRWSLGTVWVRIAP